MTWLDSTRLSAWMVYPWVWPTLEIFHFLGLTLLMGTVVLLDLRLLGMGKGLPVGPLHQFIPWGIAGFIVNLITGLLFFVGSPTAYAYNIAFQLKMIAILLAGMNVLVFYLILFRKAEALGPGDDAPLAAKCVAGTSLFLWLSVIVLGRYIALY
jgi:hypothetical protein